MRQRVFAHYFGLQSDAADAFMAAFRIPNFLQNLFGEGALSASFIPVYAALTARKDHREAARVAGAVAALLSLITSALVLVGVLFTPLLVTVIAPGFRGEKRDLTIAIVRILFPGAGLLVLSAWCLGILNSHRRFLLSYLAPVIWNVSMIATLMWWGARAPLPSLAIILAWGAVAGSALQLLVQLPSVLKLVPDLRFRLDFSDHVRTTLRNFVPVFVSRGVVQISAYIDEVLASLLPTGAVTGLANAQLLYTLPVSLFGLSVSAAALPAMSGAVGLDAAQLLRDRVNNGLRQIAFFVVPSAVAFLALGRCGRGGAVSDRAIQVTKTRCMYGGFLQARRLDCSRRPSARLYSSTYYALRDTRTPLRYALVHVGVATGLGYVAAIVLPPALGIEPLWGTVGLTTAASIAGWIELILLRRTLNQRIGQTGLPASLERASVGCGLRGGRCRRGRSKSGFRLRIRLRERRLCSRRSASRSSASRCCCAWPRRARAWRACDEFFNKSEDISCYIATSGSRTAAPVDGCAGPA